MALIKCPECGNEISDKAKSCPHCGYAQEESKVVIYGLTQMVVGGALKIFVDNELKATVDKGEKIEIPIDRDCTITARCGINPMEGKVDVKQGKTTVIKYKYNRITGGFIPCVDDLNESSCETITTVAPAIERTTENTTSSATSNTSLEADRKKPWIVLGVISAIVLLIIIIVSASNSAAQAPYKKYAGTYYSNLAGSGNYVNYPSTIVFEEDGTGRYGWKGSWYSFTYTIDGNKVKMNAGFYFEYDGYFTDSGSYKVEDSRGGLSYGKRSDW